ncbi:MAG: hypothetical protein NTY08_11765 [Proteobacteria bacterium]|nr:hypothetical protein [Pseudomonadota bacterium]
MGLKPAEGTSKTTATPEHYTVYIPRPGMICGNQDFLVHSGAAHGLVVRGFARCYRQGFDVKRAW